MVFVERKWYILREEMRYTITRRNGRKVKPWRHSNDNLQTFFEDIIIQVCMQKAKDHNWYDRENFPILMNIGIHLLEQNIKRKYYLNIESLINFFLYHANRIFISQYYNFKEKNIEMRSNKISLGGRKTFMMFLILLKPDVLLFGCYCSVIYIYKFQLDFNTTYTSF